MLPYTDNPAEWEARVRHLCALHYGSISGGGRTIARNFTVGGHPQSRHLWRRGGLATDVVLDRCAADGRRHDDLTMRGRGSPAQFREDCRLLGVHCYLEGNHAHLQSSPPGVPV